MWILLVCSFQACQMVSSFATFEACEAQLLIVEFPVYAICQPGEVV